MANLKELKASIASVQSTKRITSAMKMVAAAKLKRASDKVLASRPYADDMGAMLNGLAKGSVSTHPLMVGTGKDDTHLLVIVSSDRGLCGGFNGNLIRFVRKHIAELKSKGKAIKLIVVGRKGVTLLRREFSDVAVSFYEDLNKPQPEYANAEQIANQISDLLAGEEFDVCTLLYNKAVSALEQVPTPLQIIPLGTNASVDVASNDSTAVYDYEPSEDAILEALLPKNVTIQVFKAMLESFSAEQAARMTAMDNATRNASDMINELSVKYNRTRQAQITKELIEIISGAEAL